MRFLALLSVRLDACFIHEARGGIDTLRPEVGEHFFFSRFWKGCEH
jgi:hypothetical protein